MMPQLVADALKGRHYLAAMDFPLLNYQQTQGSFGFLPLMSFLTFPTTAKRVVTIHEIDAIQSHLKLKNLKLNTIALNKIYNKADQIIVQNSAMLESIVELGVCLEKISVIPHGTYIPQMEQLDRDQVIFCGGHKIAKGKGFETFIQAVSILKNQNIRLNVVIYGLNSVYGQIEGKALAEKFGVAGQIEWFDYNFEDAPLNAKFQKSKLMVIPYISSEAGAQVTSAMANAVPVIATKNVGLPEYLGEDGFYVKENDAEDLVDKLKLLINNRELREKVGSKLRKRALEYYSWDVVAKKTHDLFNDILGGNGSRGIRKDVLNCPKIEPARDINLSLRSISTIS